MNDTGTVSMIVCNVCLISATTPGWRQLAVVRCWGYR